MAAHQAKLDFRQQRRSPVPKEAAGEEEIESSTQLETSAAQDVQPPLQDEETRVLKEFDMDYTYGPVVGITRLERWERAKKFGLNPPEGVRELIERHSHDPAYTQCLWHDTLVGDHSEEVN